MVDQYLEMLTGQPDLPIFVLSEIRNHPERFASQFNIKKMVLESHLVKQLQEVRPDLSPFHFIFNLLGLILFPFIGRPVLETTGKLNPRVFGVMIEERRQMIPLWIKAMLEVKSQAK